jgi:hypothetical protein
VQVLVTGAPRGLASDFGGPEVLGPGDMVATWRAVRGGPRALPLRLPGAAARGFERGLNTAPDHPDGRMTWREHVRSVAGAPRGRER